MKSQKKMEFQKNWKKKNKIKNKIKISEIKNFRTQSMSVSDNDSVG